MTSRVTPMRISRRREMLAIRSFGSSRTICWQAESVSSGSCRAQLDSSIEALPNFACSRRRREIETAAADAAR